MAEPGPSGTDSSGGTEPKKPQVVFMTRADMARDPRVIDEFDVIYIEGAVPRCLRKRLKKLARRGRKVTTVRL